MQVFMIAILFVILVMALTLGFVIYRISVSATVKDVDRIVDDVNTLQTDLKKEIAKNKSGVLAVKESNEKLNKEYINLSSSNSVFDTDLGVVKASTCNLSLATHSNNSNISSLQKSLAENYLRTDALNSSLSTREFSFLHLDDPISDNLSYLKVSNNKLKFCTASVSDKTSTVRASERCSDVTVAPSSA